MKKNERIKKLLALALASLMLISMVACVTPGNDDITTPDDPDVTTPNAEVTTTQPDTTTKEPNDVTTKDPGLTDGPEFSFDGKLADENGVSLQFTSAAPENFLGIDAIKIPGNAYVATPADCVTALMHDSGIMHYYLDTSKNILKPDSTDAYMWHEYAMTYTVEVPVAGEYELLVEMRLKDDTHRYNILTVNGDTANPIIMDFQMPTVLHAEYVRDANQSSYMAGYKVNLNAGENTLTMGVDERLGQEKTFHFRNLYLYKEGSNAGAFAGRLYDEHGVALKFTSAAPERFLGADALKISGGAYTATPADCVTALLHDSGITHYYLDTSKNILKPDSTDTYLWHEYAMTYTVTVPADGEYELMIEMRLKDDTHRYNILTVNGDTENPIIMDFQMPTILDAESVRDANQSSFMVGYKVTLKAGENTLTMGVDECLGQEKTFHFRNLYLYKEGANMTPAA